MKIKIKNPLDFLEQLKKKGKPFTLISTTFTKTIVTEGVEYYYSSAKELSQAELSLIKQVKDYVVNKNIKANLYGKRIHYTDKSTIKNGEYIDKLYEIDLKSAYWNFAFKNGFISKEIYNKGNNQQKIGKKARLISLGNLAKRTISISFDGKEFEKKAIVETAGTADIFFKVSQQTDTIMNHCKFIAGNDYLFYWVDAIFIKGDETLKQISDYLKDINIDFKIVEIKKILKTPEFIKVWDDSRVEPRPFMFESLNIKDLSSIFA